MFYIHNIIPTIYSLKHHSSINQLKQLKSSYKLFTKILYHRIEDICILNIYRILKIIQIQTRMQHGLAKIFTVHINSCKVRIDIIRTCISQNGYKLFNTIESIYVPIIYTSSHELLVICKRGSKKTILKTHKKHLDLSSLFKKNKK